MKTFAAFLFSFLLSTSLCTGALLVGIGKQDLTPPIGSPSAGYAERRGTGMEGVHDPLLAIALFIDNCEKKIVFCSVDHLGFMYDMVQEVIQSVHSHPELSDCDIYIGSSHTHSGGGGYLNIPGLGAMLAGTFNPDLRRLYIEKTAAAIIEASRSPIAAKIGIGYGNASSDLSYYRASWPQEIKPLSNIAVIKVTKLDGAPYALLFNYAVHPTVLDSKNKQFSSDLVGYAREEMSSFGGQALFFNGAQGDINPTLSDSSKPWCACASLGSSLAKSVKKIWEATAVSDAVTFKTIKKSYTFEPKATPAGLVFPIDHYQTELNLIVINDKDAFVTIPGELSCIYDKHLKEIGNECGYKEVSILGLVNDAHGYIILPDAWRHKTKESALSFGGEEYGDFVEKNAIALLKSLYPHKR